MRVAAVRSAGVRRAAGAVMLLVLAADQLSKSLVVAARPGDGHGAVAVTLARTASRGAALFSPRPGRDAGQSPT